MRTFALLALALPAAGLVAPVAHRRTSTARPATAGPRPEYVPGVISDPGYVRIFDTTLRDGEQSPGATLTSSEKLEIAKQLAKLGVDIIEAGFPIASPDDFDAVQQIAKVVGNDVREDGYVPVICGLSRANPKDIERAWEAVKPATRPRVHLPSGIESFLLAVLCEIRGRSRRRRDVDSVVHSRHRRGRDVDIQWCTRGAAAAATYGYSAEHSRRRRDVDIQ